MERFKAIQTEFDASEKYGIPVSEQRYVIVDIETGEIVDDAQGYGYRTNAAANRSFGWKQKHRRRK